jgi:hypothetical protein
MAPTAGANFETGKRVDKKDFYNDVTGSAIMSHLVRHNLEELFTFNLNGFSYNWIKDFYENAQC